MRSRGVGGVGNYKSQHEVGVDDGDHGHRHTRLRLVRSVLIKIECPTNVPPDGRYVGEFLQTLR